MTALEKVCAALAQAKLRFAIVGGHAVALHGAVRGTVDIDLPYAREVAKVDVIAGPR